MKRGVNFANGTPELIEAQNRCSAAAVSQLDMDIFQFKPGSIYSLIFKPCVCSRGLAGFNVES